MEKEILEGDKLIAEFMGEKVLPIKDGDLFPVIEGEFGLRQTKYHTSWDWLMPVVIKIFQLKNIEGLYAQLNTLTEAYMMMDLKHLFPAVVQFIHFYNTQSK